MDECKPLCSGDIKCELLNIEVFDKDGNLVGRPPCHATLLEQG